VSLLTADGAGWTLTIISTFLFRNLMERDRLIDQGIDERATVKFIIEKYIVTVYTAFN
jgi:hypothetical protein